MVVILKVNLHSGTVSRVKRFFDTQAASQSPRAALKAHYLHGRFGHLKVAIPNWPAGRGTSGNCRSTGASGFESINVQIAPDHNLAVVGLTDLPQQLTFASCFSALRCPRLITARVRAAVEDQQSRLCFVGDFGELFRRCVIGQPVFLPFGSRPSILVCLFPHDCPPVDSLIIFFRRLFVRKD